MEIEYNNCIATIRANDSKDQIAVSNLYKTLTTMAPGAEHTKAYKKYRATRGKQGWDGKAYMMREEMFPTGLLESVLTELEKSNITPTLIDKRIVKAVPSLAKHSVPLRDYQEEALKAVLLNSFNGSWYPRGILGMATGSGKTEIAAAIHQAVPVPTLFLVHRKDLMKQTIDRFEKYGIAAGQLGAGKRDTGKVVTVATIQTIDSILNRTGKGRREILNALGLIEMVMFDEAHLLAADLSRGNTFIRVSRVLESAYIRIGLTATPFMRDNYSNWLLEGETGPVRYAVKNETLIEQGWLTPPKIEMLKVPEVSDIRGSWADQYDMGIVCYRPRNKMIVDQIERCPKPLLVMVTRVDHAKILQAAAELRGLKIPVLQGTTPLAERARVTELMRQQKIDAVICTTIFDEGIDIPALRTIILAGGGKSRVKGLQRVGRGLRTDEGKEEVRIIDFYDAQAPMLKRHSTARRKLWAEEGFSVEIRT